MKNQKANTDPETLKVALDLGLRESGNITETAERLDTKTGVILGFVIVSVAEILGFLLLASKESGMLRTTHPKCAFTFFVLGLASLLAALCFGFLELRPKGFSFAPSLDALTGDLSKDADSVRYKCVTALQEVTSTNRDIVGQKAKLAQRTTVAAGVALACYSVVALLLAASVFL